MLTILTLGCINQIYAQKSTPVAVDDSYDLGIGFTLQKNAVDGLLANDSDANGNHTISVLTTPVINPAHGSLNLGMDGSFTYTPNPGYVGTDTFRYRVCDNGTPNTTVSLFDFNTSTITAATIGPNATSVNPNAAQTGCGIHFPSGAGGSTGFDINIPNTGGIFNFTSFRVFFEYEDQESTADIVTAGNFRIYHITGNELGLRVDVIDGNTGLPASYTTTLGSFVSGNVPYSIAYDEITGSVTYTANGTTSVISLAPANSPLNSASATNIIIGKSMDGSGSSRPSLCSMGFVDNSRQCHEADVFLTISAKMVTNRKITYRVNPN